MLLLVLKVNKPNDLQHVQWKSVVFVSLTLLSAFVNWTLIFLEGIIHLRLHEISWVHNQGFPPMVSEIMAHKVVHVPIPLNLWVCYITWQRRSVQMDVRLPLSCPWLGRLSCITLVSPIQSQRSLPVEEGGRKVRVKEEMWQQKKIEWGDCWLWGWKGVTRHTMWVAFRSRKGKEMDSPLRASRNNGVLSTPPILDSWPPG